jgi:hypothetical protein
VSGWDAFFRRLEEQAKPFVRRELRRMGWALAESSCNANGWRAIADRDRFDKRPNVAIAGSAESLLTECERINKLDPNPAEELEIRG